MAVRFVGLEGVLAADADIRSASLIVYHHLGKIQDPQL